MIPWFSSYKKKPEKEPDSKGQDFISIASHELRSPLSIVKWYVEILLDEDMGPLNEDQKKYLRVVEASNERAIDLVRSLLNVSRLELGTFSVSPEETSPHKILEEVVSLHSAKALTKGVQLHLEAHVEDSLKMTLDRKLTALLMKSLLSNAISFTKGGGKVTVSLTVVKPLSEVTGTLISYPAVVISVKDNGIGIKDNEKNKVFSKMFKGSNVHEVEKEGSGLGLYIAKELSQNLGGDLLFESKEGEGSQFYLVLPLSGMKERKGKTTLD